MQTMLSYLGYSNFGVDKYLFREIPLLRGKNETLKVNEIIQITFSFTLITTIIVSIIGLPLSILLFKEVEIYNIIIFFILFLTQKICEITVSITYGLGEYQFALKSETIYSLINLFLIIVLTLVFGLFGALIAYTISNLIWYFQMVHRLSLKFNFNTNFKFIIPIIKEGLELLTYKISYVLFLSFNTIIIGIYYDLETVGRWGFASSVLLILDLIPSAVNRIVETKVGEIIGKVNDNGDSNSVIFKVTYYSDYYILFFVSISITILAFSPFFFHVIMKDYMESAYFIAISLPGFVVFKSVHPFAGAILSSKMQRYLIYFLIILIMLNIAGLMLVYYSGLSLFFGALIMTALQVIYAFITLIIFKRKVVNSFSIKNIVIKILTMIFLLSVQSIFSYILLLNMYNLKVAFIILSISLIWGYLLLFIITKNQYNNIKLSNHFYFNKNKPSDQINTQN